MTSNIYEEIVRKEVKEKQELILPSDQSGSSEVLSSGLPKLSNQVPSAQDAHQRSS